MPGIVLYIGRAIYLVIHFTFLSMDPEFITSSWKCLWSDLFLCIIRVEFVCNSGTGVEPQSSCI